jgi:predicted RNA methylase
VEASALAAIEERNARPIAHLDRRLLYEKAMLEAEGKSELLEKPKRPKAPPLLNYRAEQIRVWQKWSGELQTYNQTEMTKAEYKALYHEDRWTVLSEDRSHRIRYMGGMREGCAVVFLTDSKEHPRPEAGEPVSPRRREPPAPLPALAPPKLAADDPERETFDAMRESLRNGVQTVSAPSLFQTPPQLAETMAAMADLKPGHRILEPSAGMGALLRAIHRACGSPFVEAVEINNGCLAALHTLRDTLDAEWLIFPGDFSDFADDTGEGFDRVVMNPPFEKGQDAAHVQHAFSLLKPGGRLVAVMSPGPFFRESRADSAFRVWFSEVGGTVEELPAGTFKEAGTGVSSRLVVIDK